jgi:hypothetical protein
MKVVAWLFRELRTKYPIRNKRFLIFEMYFGRLIAGLTCWIQEIGVMEKTDLAHLKCCIDLHLQELRLERI